MINLLTSKCEGWAKVCNLKYPNIPANSMKIVFHVSRNITFSGYLSLTLVRNYYFERKLIVKN